MNSEYFMAQIFCDAIRANVVEGFQGGGEGGAGEADGGGCMTRNCGKNEAGQSLWK